MGRGWIALGLGIALVIGACSGDAEPPPLTDPATTPSSVAAAVKSTTTTDAATTTFATTIATTTLPTAPAEERVGSLAKFEEQIDAVYERAWKIRRPPGRSTLSGCNERGSTSLRSRNWSSSSTTGWFQQIPGRDWVPSVRSLTELLRLRSLIDVSQADRYGAPSVSLMVFDRRRIRSPYQ